MTNMNIRFIPLLILLSIVYMSGCTRIYKISLKDLPVDAHKKDSYLLASYQSVTPTKTGSIENFKTYLSDNENSLYRGEALKRLAELELQESEYVNSQLLDQGIEKNDRLLMDSIEHYTIYLKLYPDKNDNDDVLYQLAKAYEFVGDVESSLATLDTLIQRYPKTPHYDEAQFRRGEILFVFNDYSQAELAYADIVSNSKSSQYLEKAAYKLAWSQFKQAKYVDSLENCIVLLDRMNAKGKLKDSFIKKGQARSENEFVSDILRVMSLSFSYINGSQTIQLLLADKQKKTYEALLYWHLSQLYSKTGRTLDAANVYHDYVKLRAHTLQAAEFQIMIIQMYSDTGLVKLLLASKADFVKNFGVGTIFWKNHEADIKQSIKAELKTNIKDLAKYYHAVALKSGSLKDYHATSFWYEEYIRSFPEDLSTPMMNFLLAESRYQAGQFHKALTQYIKTAYDYPLHTKSAESGYAAILTYRLLIDKAVKHDKVKLEALALNNAIRFTAEFRHSSYAPAVIANTTEKLYQNKNYKGVVEYAAKNSHLKKLPDQSHFKTTWLLYAHSLFEIKKYALAELAYSTLRDVLVNTEVIYQDVTERLAASIYKQAEMYHNIHSYKLAVHHFLRIGILVPQSKIYPTAQYDAAATLILLKDWVQATSILEDFRKRFPTNKKYQQGISEKLVLTYTKMETFDKAADEALYLSKTSTNIAERRNYLWLSAELYQKSGSNKKANEIYISYIKKYPEPFTQNIETHQLVIDYYRKNEESTRLKKWLLNTVVAEKRGKNNRTERTKYIAAVAALELANPLVVEFKQIELTVPLKKSLRAKKTLMQAALKSFSDLMTYEIADITTESTYHVADIYGHFAKALMESQRPANLNEEEIEQYDILLEEQAYPFEEKSIEIHLTNAKRTSDGFYDKWVKGSITALAILQPIRFSKTERIETYVTRRH